MLHQTPPIRLVRDVQRALRGAGAGAVIGGSGLLVSLGLADSARDWDVVVDAEPAAVSTVLCALNLTVVQIPPCGVFRSAALFRIVAADHDIDVMVGFALADGAQTRPIPARSGAGWRGLVMADPRDWALAYRLMDRPKQAAALEAWIAHNVDVADDIDAADEADAADELSPRS